MMRWQRQLEACDEPRPSAPEQMAGSAPRSSRSGCDGRAFATSWCRVEEGVDQLDWWQEVTSDFADRTGTRVAGRSGRRQR